MISELVAELEALKAELGERYVGDAGDHEAWEIVARVERKLFRRGRIDPKRVNEKDP